MGLAAGKARARGRAGPGAGEGRRPAPVRARRAPKLGTRGGAVTCLAAGGAGGRGDADWNGYLCITTKLRESIYRHEARSGFGATGALNILALQPKAPP
jgi:hypothetical protein